MTAEPQTNASETCADCGAVIADPALHRSWHSELPQAISKAVIEYVDKRRA